eukprot:gene3527-4028_t
MVLEHKTFVFGDLFVSSGKLPTANNPNGIDGLKSRSSVEKELDKFIAEKQNKLGYKKYFRINMEDLQDAVTM